MIEMPANVFIIDHRDETQFVQPLEWHLSAMTVSAAEILTSNNDYD